MMPKTVFISWSGPQSKHIAKALKEGLSYIFRPAYLQIWLSTEIVPGARWSDAISKKLEEANYGILCLTRENLNRPWIFFEAGAISKVVGEAHVCPYLHEVEVSLLQQSPLGQFQAVRVDKEGTLELVHALHSLLYPPLYNPSTLNDIFEVMWKNFDQCLSAIPEVKTVPKSDVDRYFHELRMPPDDRSIEPYELTTALHTVIRGILQEFGLSWTLGPGVDYQVVIGNRIILLETKVRIVSVRDKKCGDHVEGREYVKDAVKQMNEAIQKVCKDKVNVEGIIVIPDFPETLDTPNHKFLRGRIPFLPTSRLKKHLSEMLKPKSADASSSSNTTADGSTPA
jgi:hypothetical protein